MYRATIMIALLVQKSMTPWTSRLLVKETKKLMSNRCRYALAQNLFASESEWAAIYNDCSEQIEEWDCVI